LEGDKALISVAKILNSLLQRPDDYVFRLGGEEFGVLLSQSTKESASQMAQKINTAVIEAEIPHAGSKVNKYLSISIGLVVVHPTMDLNNEKLLSEADKNLYEAKESGRNRYVVSEI
jgi:diguanylate cyclase (GGDEF)-like protein